MTRSCSDQHGRCLHNPSGRVHSLDPPQVRLGTGDSQFDGVVLIRVSRLLQSITETWSDNRLSVPLYPDEDYNIPYNSSASNISSQQNLDLSCRSNKVPHQA